MTPDELLEQGQRRAAAFDAGFLGLSTPEAMIEHLIKQIEALPLVSWFERNWPKDDEPIPAPKRQIPQRIETAFTALMDANLQMQRDMLAQAQFMSRRGLARPSPYAARQGVVRLNDAKHDTLSYGTYTVSQEWVRSQSDDELSAKLGAEAAEALRRQVDKALYVGSGPTKPARRSAFDGDNELLRAMSGEPSKS